MILYNSRWSVADVDLCYILQVASLSHLAQHGAHWIAYLLLWVVVPIEALVEYLNSLGREPRGILVADEFSQEVLLAIVAAVAPYQHGVKIVVLLQHV